MRRQNMKWKRRALAALGATALAFCGALPAAAADDIVLNEVLWVAGE